MKRQPTEQNPVQQPYASVVATGQQMSRDQRQGRYTPASMRHPGKMLPAIARHVISAYTRAGDVVADPMCGIGTSLVEAIHLGRDAIGTEVEGSFTQLTRGNLLLARSQGATATGRVVCADGRAIASMFPDHRGRVALVLTSPPYGASTHGHVRPDSPNVGGKVEKYHFRYTHERRSPNLARQPLQGLLAGFGAILDASASMLKPGGSVAVTVRPFRSQGALIDLPGRVIEVAEEHGLALIDRRAVLLAALRDGGLVTRASFFQILETRRARRRGLPACTPAHEDLLIFSRATDLSPAAGSAGTVEQDGDRR
ncbi:TRM11 family SAM-dependent methyltransferase [Actinomadura rupiterrae]|uniref:TRM11 family SAM-dependent methyltransferase n=1 Tax=Actinomadura rupiterrae TaxID=559627 RepID=UPI0020A26215|nr:DNA methyltransferase [Actinomadura rupiterrae]MCP2342934.1 tRNA G10 N-methylase Trm11 [Actinomadura rupiterrae]